MELRSGAMPDQPTERPAGPRQPVDRRRPATPVPLGRSGPGVAEAHDTPAEPVDAGPGPWHADRRLMAFKIIGVLVFGAAALLVVNDPIGTALLLIAALVCALYALRDLAAPVRLAADADGLRIIHGYLGHTRLSWAEVEKITVDRRGRLGLRSELLEIDAGERLYLLSSYDLSTDPAAVAAALLRIRTGG